MPPSLSATVAAIRAQSSGLATLPGTDERLAAELRDLLGDLVEPALGAGHEGHRRALTGQRERRRLSQPGADSGDDRDLLREQHGLPSPGTVPGSGRVSGAPSSGQPDEERA